MYVFNDLDSIDEDTLFRYGRIFRNSTICFNFDQLAPIVENNLPIFWGRPIEYYEGIGNRIIDCSNMIEANKEDKKIIVHSEIIMSIMKALHYYRNGSYGGLKIELNYDDSLSDEIHVVNRKDSNSRFIIKLLNTDMIDNSQITPHLTQL